MAASLKCLLWSVAERYASAARAVVLLIVGAGPRRAVRRLVTILRREAAAGVSAALLHIADACCAAGVAIPHVAVRRLGGDVAALAVGGDAVGGLGVSVRLVPG